MDEPRKETNEELEDTGYTPRPAWQVTAARIGLVFFLAFLALYYLNILRGGA